MTWRQGLVHDEQWGGQRKNCQLVKTEWELQYAGKTLAQIEDRHRRTGNNNKKKEIKVRKRRENGGKVLGDVV